MSLLRDLCVDEERLVGLSNPYAQSLCWTPVLRLLLFRMSAGFNTLREFVASRPTLRHEALRVLLELTTHYGTLVSPHFSALALTITYPEKITRGAAINTIKRWVPDVQPMDSLIRDFALRLLRRLQSRSPPPEQMDVDPGTTTAEDNMEDGQLPTEALVKTPYLSDTLQLPAEKGQVLQHVELMFALTVKVPEFLDESVLYFLFPHAGLLTYINTPRIFAAYGQMDISVQEHMQVLISPLIRALGSSHGKLLTLLRTFPSGAESLALRIIAIFTDSGRPSAQLVTLVKALVSERDLDARFLIPVIAEMDKVWLVSAIRRMDHTEWVLAG